MNIVSLYVVVIGTVVYGMSGIGIICIHGMWVDYNSECEKQIHKNKKDKIL